MRANSPHELRCAQLLHGFPVPSAEVRRALFVFLRASELSTLGAQTLQVRRHGAAGRVDVLAHQGRPEVEASEKSVPVRERERGVLVRKTESALPCGMGMIGRAEQQGLQFQALDGPTAAMEALCPGSLIQDEQTLGFLRHAGPAAATGGFARELRRVMMRYSRTARLSRRSARLLAGWSLPHVSPLGGLIRQMKTGERRKSEQFSQFPLLRPVGIQTHSAPS